MEALKKAQSHGRGGRSLPAPSRKSSDMPCEPRSVAGSGLQIASRHGLLSGHDVQCLAGHSEGDKGKAPSCCCMEQVRHYHQPIEGGSKSRMCDVKPEL